MYESVVTRAAQLLQVHSITEGRAIDVDTRLLRRSELATLSDCVLPSAPCDLVVIAHRVSGARNPITDANGLYTDLISRAWHRAEVVLICLFDVPHDYLPRLLAEQPTLLRLLRVGRLLPLFFRNHGAAEMGSSTADCGMDHEAAWWIVRCLDGRIPKVDYFSDLSQPVPLSSVFGSQLKLPASHQEASQGDIDDCSSSSLFLRASAKSGDALSLLCTVVESFEGQLLIQN